MHVMFASNLFCLFGLCKQFFFPFNIFHTPPPPNPLQKKKMVGPLVVDQSFVGLKGSFTVRRMSLNQNTFVLFLSIVLLVFSVTPFKIDQNKKSKLFNRVSPESGNRKKVDMKRLSPRFRSQRFFLWKICGETFSPNL